MRSTSPLMKRSVRSFVSARAKVKGEKLDIKRPDSLSALHSQSQFGFAYREFFELPINQITEIIRIALEKTPPELSSDIVERGITMAGGGSLLRNLDKLMPRSLAIGLAYLIVFAVVGVAISYLAPRVANQAANSSLVSRVLT